MNLPGWMDDDDPLACLSLPSAHVREALSQWPPRPDAGLRAARLMAVAAAYEQLTAPRWGSRRAMTPDDASAALVRRAGIDLDPDAVRAWLYAQEVRRCS